MKTPEEIKQALRVCMKGMEMDCVSCPYKYSGISRCFETLLMRDALEYIEKLERSEEMNSNDDLLRREDVVNLLKNKGRGYTASMFTTSYEFETACIITLECVNEVRNMPAYSKGEDE